MQLNVNGQSLAVDDAAVDPSMPLLWVLRDVLDLTGTKFGCGIGACGACTVHLDGARGALLRDAAGGGRRARPSRTIEALGTDAEPHPLQAGLDRAPGAAVRLLPERHADGRGRAARRATRSPSDAEIDAAMTQPVPLRHLRRACARPSQAAAQAAAARRPRARRR